jgi:hypothetical protein
MLPQICEKMFGQIKDTFLRIRSLGRKYFILLIIKQGELTNINSFLLTEDVSE